MVIGIDLRTHRSRLECNRVIMEILNTVILKYPDWRFQQILWNCGISNGTDLFHEESGSTLRRLLADSTVQEFFVAVDEVK